MLNIKLIIHHYWDQDPTLCKLESLNHAQEDQITFEY